MSASSTWMATTATGQQQWQLQLQTQTRAGKCEPNRQMQMGKHEWGQVNANRWVWMRAGKHEWGWVGECEQEWVNRSGWMRAGEQGGGIGASKWEQANANEGSWVGMKVGEQQQQQQQQFSLPLPFLFNFLLGENEWQPSHSIPPLIIFKYYNIIVIIFFIIKYTAAFVRHHTNTGRVWKILTCSIPAPNPRHLQPQ